MKSIILSVAVLFFLKGAAAQPELPGSRPHWQHPVQTPAGLVFTDSHCSALYLYDGDSCILLHSSPGCGRYLSFSEDRNYCGIKHIGSDGKQQPAIIDLKNRKLILLHTPEEICGQTFFFRGGYGFAIGKTLFVCRKEGNDTLDLFSYSNITPASPDGNYIAYADGHGRVIIADFFGNHKCVSGDSTDFFRPCWSPDGLKLLYSGVRGEINIFDITSGNTSSFSGLEPKWGGNNTVLFHRIESGFGEDVISGIYFRNLDNHKEGRMNPQGFRIAMDVSEGTNGRLYFHTGEGLEIFSAVADYSKGLLTDLRSEFRAETPPQIQKKPLPEFNAKANIMLPGTVPYLHQVYDTPDWHSGSWSCAPSTAIMALAYFNKLPPWPVTCSLPSSHISQYGNYVASKYRFREQYYDAVASDAGGNDAWGGYGFMWNGSYSPNGRMGTYINQHDMIGTPQYWTASCKWDTTLQEINAGFPHPICSNLTTSGHLTLCIGYISGQHTLIFHDPYGNKNNGYVNYNGQNVCYDWPGYNNGYSNLNTVAWTVKARGSQPVYNDTLIDDIFYNHGFYIHNQPPSQMRYYRDRNSGGYNGHFWYTFSSPSTVSDTCYVTWSPNLPQRSQYEVLAYIPSSYANASSCKYKIYYDGGNTTVTLNQNNQGGWVSLGTYIFNAGTSGYVRLGDGTGTQGQYLAFDAMRFRKIGAIDSAVPLTSVTTPQTWKTAAFAADFADTDNQGGTGVEKRFYQALEFVSGEWRGNENNGFFNDDFNSGLHPAWIVPSGGGSWNISGGRLLQSDQTSANSNIYTSLNQTATNEYLYHWQFSLSGNGSTRRSGMHIFSDNPTQTNRGNSYLFWFSDDEDLFRIYKTVNNNLGTAVVTVPATLSTGVNYDVKVVFSPSNGRIEVYLNNQQLTTWIDPAPHTAGTGISLRSNGIQAYFDELRVYRGRGNSETVTVGPASVNDVRQQNPSPATPACMIRSLVRDLALNWSASATQTYNTDWTAPPAPVYVHDLVSGDADTSFTDILSCIWSITADPNSGTYASEYAAGTSPGLQNIIPWTNINNGTQFLLNPAGLTSGQWVYQSVKTINGAGLLSSETVSDGFVYLLPTTVSENPETANIVFPNPCKSGSPLYFQWSGSGHPQCFISDMSGRVIMQIQPGKSRGISEVLPAGHRLSCGIYLLTIISENKNIRSPLIIY